MCALPLSKVLPQRRTNSLDAERENFERLQSVSISKAINCQESPVKEKHVRSAIIGTFNEKGAGTFWSVVLKLPLQGNPIVCWKFCHVLHKVVREGHAHAIADSQKYRTSLADLGKLWGLLKDGYGRLIQCYCTLLNAKLDFHRRNPRFPGSLAVTDEELDDIGERDVNVFFQLSCEFFDYMDEILALQLAVFGSLDMSRSNSMTNCGQCRLAPLIPCIQDSSNLYDYTVKVLFKLHSALPADTLAGHRDRFLKQFKSLQQFYLNASSLQYFKHLIHVPLLPENPPNFLIASDLSTHVSPVVILPPQSDTPENETVDMNLVDTTVPKSCPSPDVLDGVFATRNASDFHQRNGSSSPDHMTDKDSIIEKLQREIELLKMDIQRMRIEYERKIDDFKRQMVAQDALISEQDRIIQSLRDETESLKQNVVIGDSASELSLKLDETEKKKKAHEEKYLKMKEFYSKLREEHISLLRGKAEVDKQISVLKTSFETLELEKQELSQKVMNLSNSQIKEEQLQKSENWESQIAVIKEEKSTLQKNNEEILAQLTEVKASYHYLENSYQQAQMNMNNLDENLKVLQQQCNSLQNENKLQSDKKFSYLDCVLKESEHIVQVAYDDLENPAVAVNNCSPEHFMRHLDSIAATAEQFQDAYKRFSNDPHDIDGMFQFSTFFSHQLANVLMEGKSTSNASPNIEQGDELLLSCRQMGLSGVTLFNKLLKHAPQSEIMASFSKTSSEISHTLKVMSALVPNMSQDNQKLGDIIEQELKQMDLDIEEAAQKIQEMLTNSRAGDSGLKLEVNNKILDSCTSLMQAIKELVHSSKHLQAEIVSQGKGTASEKEFYNRNHRWTEGLISAAKVVGLGARFLVNAADKVVSKQTKFEELVVASQEIAAATAQLVIASRVKADRGSEKMAKVSQASKRVTEATGQVVATAKSCAEMVEERDEMDFSKLSLHQAKCLEVESQIRVLELESMLVKERVKLAGLRKKHYQLAGASEGWDEDVAN